MIDVVVEAKHEEAEGIFGFVLAPLSAAAALPSWEAGAHIDVHVAPGVIRQYSLCGPPGTVDRYHIAVLQAPDSRGGSRQLAEGIEVGRRLAIGAPRNHFPLAAGSHRSLLFAGGIGITPILAMAETLSTAGADFELHYCTRAPERTAFRARLEASGFADRVRIHFNSEPGRSRLDAAALLRGHEDGRHLYVCGPAGFMAHVLDTAERLGWPAERLHREYFSAPVEAHGADGGFSVRIASTGATYPVPADRTVAAVLAEAGIEIALSCEQGLCGTCLTHVLDGMPDHRDVFMTDAEHARNDMFTPCCSRALSAMLVLDL